MKKRTRRVPAGIAALFCALVFSGCGDKPNNEIVRIPTNLSDVFYIRETAAAGHADDCGWLVPNADGKTWRMDNTALGATADSNGNPYDGVRVWNIDGDLLTREIPFDASVYDGIVFKYRTNCTEVVPKFLDFSYRWAVYGIGFKAFDYLGGFENPTEYKEIIAPFFKAVRNVEALSGREDNNPNNFDYNQLRWLNFDMRSSVDGGAFWCEIVDFDFFVYKK